MENHLFHTKSNVKTPGLALEFVLLLWFRFRVSIHASRLIFAALFRKTGTV